MATITKNFEQLYTEDDVHLSDEGKVVGNIDILNRDGYTNDVKVIGCVYPYGNHFPDHEEAKRYATLFAAAPDLLEAAQYAIECLDRLNSELGQIGDAGDQAYNALKEAIQKATTL